MLLNKEQRVYTGIKDSEYTNDVIAELDLEISLRQRLAKALRSRVTWALSLQDALSNGSNGSQISFKSAAFDALSAMDTPLEVLFTREVLPIVKAPQPIKGLRLPPKSKPPTTRNPNVNFLYIKSVDLHSSYDQTHIHTYLLRCPQCLRTTFTSLQGLLNHARISHSLEWGTHDECVRACAVMDESLNVEEGIEVGLGPNGLLPGIRSLFQKAVRAPQFEQASLGSDVRLEITGGRAAHPPTHSIRTLGIHEDTPALALFLGKQALRRSIKVWGCDEEVDIINVGSDRIPEVYFLPTKGVAMSQNIHQRQRGSSGRIWRMQFAHRNDFDPHDSPHLQQVDPSTPHDRDIVEPRPISAVNERIGDLQPRDAVQEMVSTVIPGSRFHFMARIIIVDRSLWVPPERRQKFQENQTHKWMISVDSPSYSHHITTILQKITVTAYSGSTSKPSTLTATSPPFLVVGLTDRPFLAKIELCFTGARTSTGETTSQTTVLEHWVELDLLKSATQVIGDEQVVDIELDKGTIFLPIQKAYTPIGAKILWQNSIEVQEDKDETPDDSVQGYGRILDSLLGKFPMTLKDFKINRQPHPRLPYKLASTASQFRSLPAGRRKAIEWGRARALRDAYMTTAWGQPPTLENRPPLTTADVFTWLLEQGHFIRSPTLPSSTECNVDKRIEDKNLGTWCPLCGQGIEAHIGTAMAKEVTDLPFKRLIKMEDTSASAGYQWTQKIETMSHVPSCNIGQRVTKMPMFNICTYLDPLSSGDHPQLRSKELTLKTQIHKKSRGADLILVSDPRLILAVRNIARSLKLPTFEPPFRDHSSPYPLDELGMDKMILEAHLAPYATLATLTKIFIRILVEGGLEVIKEERTAFARPLNKRKTSTEKATTTVLTPVHVLSSIVSQTKKPNYRQNKTGLAVFRCLARLGVPTGP